MSIELPLCIPYSFLKLIGGHMDRLSGKIALITGGTQSIGLGIAKLFHRHGAKVIISGRKPIEEGRKIATEVGENAAYVQLNVTNESDWQTAMHWIKTEYGQLNVLVNNAGIEYPSQTENAQDPEHCTIQDWHTVHATNLDGVFLGCKHAIRTMKNCENCSIVNVGSRSGLVGVSSSAAYSSSKAAIRNYTKTVAVYCAQEKYPIRCNVVHPAAILTKIWDKEMGLDELREKRIEAFSQNIPLKRMGTIYDIAYAVLYFASDESNFITGTELVVDGGIMAGSAASANAGLLEIS